MFDAAAESHRAGAVSAPGELLGPPVEVRPTGPADDLLHRVRGKNGCRIHRSVLRTSRNGPSPRRASDTRTTASSDTTQEHRPRYTDTPWSGSPKLIKSAESPDCQVCALLS